MKNTHYKTVSRFFISMGIAFLLSSCGSSSSNSEQTDNVSKSEPKVSIDEFDLPAQIEGCSSLYANNEEGYNNNKYVFANDFAKGAYISINGVITTFTLSENAKDFGDVTIVKYKSDKYEVIITVKVRKSNGEESSIEIGTMELIDKAGKSTIKNFYGVSGC